MELGDEVVAVGELAGHTALHVVVGELAGDGKLDDDFAGAVEFQQARLGAGFGDHDAVALDDLGGVDLGLRALPLEELFTVAGNFHHAAAGVFLGLGKREQEVAAGEDVAVAGGVGVSPYGLARAIDDASLPTAGEEGMGDGDLRVTGGEAGKRQREGQHGGAKDVLHGEIEDGFGNGSNRNSMDNNGTRFPPPSYFKELDMMLGAERSAAPVDDVYRATRVRRLSLGREPFHGSANS